MASVKKLRVSEYFVQPRNRWFVMKVTLFSFGFKHGYPEAETVWDVRFLPNPYWVPELKEYPGLEEPVASYVLNNDTGREFLTHLVPCLLFLLESHKAAGRDDIILAVGCTGGRHRSVAVTSHLEKILADTEFDLTVYHRDISKD